VTYRPNDEIPRYRTRIVAEPRLTSTPALYPATRIAPPRMATPLRLTAEALGFDCAAIRLDSHVSSGIAALYDQGGIGIDLFEGQYAGARCRFLSVASTDACIDVSGVRLALRV
jgi:hypothetical protein